MEGAWTGTSTQVRPSCGSGNRCYYSLTLQLHDDRGTLTGEGPAEITYTGTRDSDGTVVLHASRPGVDPWTLIGALSADGKTFSADQFTGTATSVPTAGYLEHVVVTHQ